MRTVVSSLLLVLGLFTSARSASAAPVTQTLRTIAEAEDRRDASVAGGIPAALAHPDAAVRARAARAAGRLQDSTLVAPLQSLLADRDAVVRREAAFALGQTGHRSARTALEASLSDRDPVVVAFAIEALGKLGDRAATARLTPWLTRGTPEQRMRAAESMWRLADTSATSALLAALDARDPAVRWRVVYALEKLPQPARIVPAVAPRLTRDPDALVRAHAARTLGRLLSPLATPSLMAALADSDAAVVVNAVRGLQLVRDASEPRTPRALVSLLHHRDPHVRVTAATALADSFAWAAGDAADSVAVRAALIAGMQDGDPATRGACGRALLLRERSAALTVVGPLFADSVAYVRNAVTDGLRAMRSEDLDGRIPRVANALSGRWQVDGHRLVRMTAAEVAGQLWSRTHHPSLERLVRSLRSALGERDELVVAAAAAGLAEAGDSAAVPALVQAYARHARDADADARLGIRDALRSLAGAALADSVERTTPAPAPPLPDAAFHSPVTARHARLTTSAGVMEWEFLTADAPQTVRNFVTLAQRGYFDSLTVHRVVPDFVIQDGDPTGTGSGGPGYTIRCEYNPWRYESGMVGMALSGKDTGGSQWFVTLSPQPHLNGRYTIFARVTRGLDVARRITQGARVWTVEVLP